MPFSPNNNEITPQHEVPNHLAHKPVFALPYQAFDGPFIGDTDMRYISVGLAQYDSDLISVKTMRHVGSKWTRQAEELPPHRVLDMAAVLIKVLFDRESDGSVVFPAGTFENQFVDITLTPEERGFGENASYNAAVAAEDGRIRARLDTLIGVIDDLRQRGIIRS